MSQWTTERGKINGLQANNVLLYKSLFFLTLKMGDISWPCAMNMSEPWSTDTESQDKCVNDVGYRIDV